MGIFIILYEQEDLMASLLNHLYALFEKKNLRKYIW